MLDCVAQCVRADAGNAQEGREKQRWFNRRCATRNFLASLSDSSETD